MTSPLFEHILIAVAPDRLSVSAAARGILLARHTEARFSLVHAIELPPVLYPGVSRELVHEIHSTAIRSARNDVIEALESGLAEQEVTCGTLRDHFEVVPGTPAQVVLDEAREKRCDLILIGPHAERSILDFGSTARAVLARAEVPVWMQKEPPAPVRKILVPVDFSEHGRPSIELAQKLAERFEASITFVHCYSPPSFAYTAMPEGLPGPSYTIEGESQAACEELEKWFAGQDFGDLNASTSFVEGSTVDSLVQRAESADLVVMGTHGRTGLSRFLLGSVAYGVLLQSNTPVVVVPDKKWSN